MGKTCIERLEGNLFQALVAFLAVPLDRKRSLAFVAGTAGFALLHLGHGVGVAFVTGFKQFSMTVIAGKRHVKMLLVAE